MPESNDWALNRTVKRRDSGKPYTAIMTVRVAGGTQFGRQNLPQPPDAGLLQRAWDPPLRPRSGQAAKESGPDPSGEETGISG